MVVNKRLPTMQFGALGSMPVFILVYFITFRVSLNPTIGTMALIALQAGLIVAFGLPSVVTTFQAHTLKIRESEYVLAAQSMAASPTRIVFRHVLPQLFETVIAAVSAEMVSALTIVGQLAIFNVFIGGSLYTPDPPLFHSLTHEWAGLLGQARNMIRTQQWRLFFPLMGYLLVLISFHLLSDGVETAYRRRRRTVNYL
jgi:peptide/nickel transport system permease protein